MVSGPINGLATFMLVSFRQVKIVKGVMLANYRGKFWFSAKTLGKITRGGENYAFAKLKNKFL